MTPASNSTPILYHYPMSPFSEKIRATMGVLDTEWHFGYGACFSTTLRFKSLHWWLPTDTCAAKRRAVLLRQSARVRRIG